MTQPFYASSAINRHGNYRNDKKMHFIEQDGTNYKENTEEVSPNPNSYEKVKLQSNLETENTFDSHISANSYETREKYQNKETSK